MPNSYLSVKTNAWINCKVFILCTFVFLAFSCARNTQFTQRISIATGGTGGVYYPYGGAISKVISDHLEGIEATAEVTAGTVDNLKFIAARSADIGFALADSLDDAISGRGIFLDVGPIPARAIAVLYNNHNHLVTTSESDIDSVPDLYKRVISTGAPGSGTEVSAHRILTAAGLNPETDIRGQSLGASQSVDALRDGKIEAFFWSGGIPTGAVLDLASTPGQTMRLLATGALLESLQQKYGATVYRNSVIPKTTYPGMVRNISTIAVANVLVVHEQMEYDLAKAITAALFEYHAELSAVHPMADILSLETAVTGSPIPFHAGAEGYYRDKGIQVFD